VGFQGGTPDFETDQASLAAFMMGIAGTSGKSSQYIKMDSLENQYALYIRDRWRATPKLTFTLGLRWELYPNRRRSAGLGIESYDPTTNEALIGGRGGIPQDNGVGWSKKLFAPRVGFAWQLANNTVIRSGYGITYHSHPWGAQALRGWFPLTVVAVFNGVNGYQPVTTDPTYVADGIPNAPLGPNVGIPSIFGFDINKGRVPLPNAAETGYPAANQLMRRGYIQSWNLIVEHKFPGEMVASIGYVASRSVRDFAFRNINTGEIPGADVNGQPLYVKFGRTASTRLWDGMLGSNYHSMQVSLNERPSSEGRLHLVACHRYGRLLRLDPAPLDVEPGVGSQSCQRDLQPTPSLAACLRVRIPLRQRQEVAYKRRRQGGPGRMAVERHLQRLPGTLFYVECQRFLIGYAGARPRPADP